MSTGQAPIIMKSSSSLDDSEVVSNIATIQADRDSAASNVDGQDIYPRTVTCEHLFAADGSFSGYLNAGTIYVGSGGVTISSAADGATPSTGLFLSSSQLIMYKSSVATFNLNGTTGDFTIQTAASGARLVLDADGLEAYNGSAVKTFDLNSADGTFTLQTASSGSRVVLSGSGLLGYNSGGSQTFILDSTTGGVTATEFILTPSATSKFRTAASGARVEIDNEGVKVYDASAAPGVVKAKLSTAGLTIRNANDMSPTVAERASFEIENGTEVGWLTGFAGAGENGILIKALTGIGAATQLELLAGAGQLTVWDESSAGYVSITGTTAITGDLSATNFQKVWTSYASESNILTAEAGITLSNITISRAVYCIVGPMCFFEIAAQFTTADCGAGDNDLYLKVPDAYTIANSFAMFHGVKIPASGARVSMWGAYADTTHLWLRAYDSSDWADGASNFIRAAGFFTWTAA